MTAIRDKQDDRSVQLFARALELMPGGVNSPVRAFRAVGGIPRFIREANGATIQDIGPLNDAGALNYQITGFSGDFPDN